MFILHRSSLGMVWLRDQLTFLAILGFPATAAHAQAAEPELRAAIVGGLDRTDSAPGSGARDGFYYAIQLGADWNLGALTAGVEGELADSTARDGSLPGQPRQSTFANVTLRLAVPISDGTRAFVRGGYAYHRIENASIGDFDGHGYVIGGGGETDLSDRLFLRAEYRYSDYGSEVRGQQFLGGIGLRF
ncbi:MAG TPA: outer membrane beta-barrel protein [Novosphingobium sp.]|nr:outer membrane beta-barrel protein [Novosphingobium sp.]